MQTVVRTTYHGPTDYNGSRFTVRDMRSGERKTVSYDYSASNASIAAIVALLGDDISVTYGWTDSNRGGRDTYYLVSGNWSEAPGRYYNY